ncbi:hypothetical protein E4V01_05850 [Methylorubrum sp. Q1]|nr:hypothetical protein E4V01_05850 [Methylorubrum sp. Q1]
MPRSGLEGCSRARPIPGRSFEGHAPRRHLGMRSRIGWERPGQRPKNQKKIGRALAECSTSTAPVAGSTSLSTAS